MKSVQSIAAVLIFSALLGALGHSSASAEPLEWSELKPLPDEFGFAGPFAGTSGGALIVAGGANFPDGYPWDGGKKVYHDRIFVLSSPGIAGLLIAAIFAAAQSTVSSSLNSVATAYVTDFHSRVFSPDSSDASRLKIAKTVVVLVGAVGIAVAWIMAKSDIESAFKTFNSLIGLTAGALGGLFALGVFNKRANGTGAVIGALIAFATVVTLFITKADVTGLLYALIGFGVCFIVGSLTSIGRSSK